MYTTFNSIIPFYYVHPALEQTSTTDGKKCSQNHFVQIFSHKKENKKKFFNRKHLEKVKKFRLENI